ncbi:MAG: ABC transporter substrate-binding protein, partial [Candidatus Methylomirabilales bacterium]
MSVVMRALSTILFSCLLVSAMIAGVGAAGGEIPIGMDTPVTGPNAANGALWIKAVKLAQKQINAAGGVNGKLINVIIEDDQSTNPGALAAVNRSIEQD